MEVLNQELNSVLQDLSYRRRHVDQNHYTMPMLPGEVSELKSGESVMAGILGGDYKVYYKVYYKI